MDRIEHLPDDGTLAPALLDKGLPRIGGILNDPPRENLIVVATFCLFGSNTEVPQYFVASEAALGDYFDHMERCAPSSPRAYFDAFRELENKLFNPQDPGEKILFSASPLLDADMESTGQEYDFGLSDQQKNALSDTVAHNHFFRIDNIKHAVDGHLLTRTNGKPEVIVTLCQWPTHTALHRAYPLDLILNPKLQSEAPTKRAKKHACKPNALG